MKKVHKIIMLPATSEHKSDYIIGDKPQHLYILSDEEIKEGDWIYEKSLSKESIFQIYKRDDKLCFFRFTNVPIWLDKSSHNAKKIIATTDLSLSMCNKSTHDRHLDCNGIASIPESFIKEYVKAQGKIDEVLVEYTHYLGENNGEDTVPNIQNRIKINSDNTINISLPETKLYTREDMKKAFNAGRHDSWFTEYGNIVATNFEFDEWIEKIYNLKY
jgi:hypothetical protein